jgi:Family of unknown function (DUF5522)
LLNRYASSVSLNADSRCESDAAEFGIPLFLIVSKKDNHNKPNNTAMFYWENGLMVFTEAYHLKRGYCCKNGCRHCPYKEAKPKSS